MIYDVLGIGFGPSNLALAIALKEVGHGMNFHFFDSKQCFGWHNNMLFKNATMQVSFLKDLVTFRNPRSDFSFIYYLHNKGRLAHFNNLSAFCPSRAEFSDYFQWCAERFCDHVTYGATVVSVEPSLLPGDQGPGWRVTYEHGSGHSDVFCRSLVYAAGLSPVMPDICRKSERVFHGSQVLERLSYGSEARGHAVVLGGGQSAAEIVEYLHDEFPAMTITSVSSGFGFMPADSTPFVNQIFDPSSVSLFFDAPSSVRKELLYRHSDTNYSVVDEDLIRSIYGKFYREEVDGVHRLSLLKVTSLISVTEADGRLKIGLRDRAREQVIEFEADYLICATGYRPRSVLDFFDDTLRAQVELDEDGLPSFTRHYRLSLSGRDAPIYCMGMNQHSHGLSSTLISNMAVRAGEIVEDIVRHVGAKKDIDLHPANLPLLPPES